MTPDCTFLVNSYDGGEDLWKPFFTALQKQWPEMDLPIVLNTESKSWSFPGYDITTFGLYPPGKKVAWGRRMIDTLERIRTKYVFWILDDFWLDAPVDHKRFEEVFPWLDENPDIASFSFHKTVDEKNNILDGCFDGYARRSQTGEYRLNCSTAVWRRERLIDFIRPHESPWEWEIWGSRRAARYPDRLYCLISEENPVISVGCRDKGGLIHRGRWVKEAVEYFSQIYDLSYIDFSKRGYEDFDEFVRVNTMSFSERLRKPHLVRRLLWYCTGYQIRKAKSLI